MQNPDLVRRYFSDIAHRYDLANRALSGGCDILWRKAAVRRVARHAPVEILDVATGSGDLMRELERALPKSRVIGTDFCLPMLQEARAKGLQRLLLADGMQLPFAAHRFDALTIAFGLRNMADYPAAAAEFHRILRPGGRLFVLDFSMPSGWFGALYRFYLHRFLPKIAGLLTGNRAAYEYLGASIEAFPSGPAMNALLRAAGFSTVTATPYNGGIVSLYEATKTEQ